MKECVICKNCFEDTELYEYRGIVACGEHFDEAIEKRDAQRKQVMEITEKSTDSQRNGEFINNHDKYNLNNVAYDGLPIVKLKEPLALKEYEKGNL